jgi:hypothetical protein
MKFQLQPPVEIEPQNTAIRFTRCRKDFTITSGTLFAAHKAPLHSYLAATAGTT